MPRRPPCSNSLTRRIKLTVAYDGTDFCGWAAQAGRRTVQSTLIEAVRRVSGEDTEIVGASRTDSGAHAKGQVCHFDTATPIEPARWTQALNRILPPDVAVCRAAYVSPRFHARFCASDRRYRYRIATGDRDPFADRYAHWLGRTLDLSAYADCGRGTRRGARLSQLHRGARSSNSELRQRTSLGRSLPGWGRGADRCGGHGLPPRDDAEDRRSPARGGPGQARR
ncbi:MAG: pseudouridylate synthase I [Armatimonadetes bacterium OLB18]|nr:MAG: pseudouridylate synthase I [Armatimonadetes bacterium OLB18]